MPADPPPDVLSSGSSITNPLMPPPPPRHAAHHSQHPPPVHQSGPDADPCLAPEPIPQLSTESAQPAVVPAPAVAPALAAADSKAIELQHQGAGIFEQRLQRLEEASFQANDQMKEVGP